MKNIIKLLSILPIFFLINGCLKDNTIQTPISVLTVINGYSPEPRLTFGLDRNNFHTGNYTTAQSFNINFGTRNISFQNANGKNLFDANFQINPMSFYSAFAYGTAASPKLILTKDSLLSDISFSAAIRFIHIANDVDAVQLFSGDEPVKGISQRSQETKESTKTTEIFVPFPTGNHVFSVRDAKGNELAKSRNITLNNGDHRTLVLWGTDDNAATPLQLVSY